MTRATIYIESNQPSDTPVSGCGCDWRGTLGDLLDVNETGAILEAGDPSPAGRCPECDGLAYVDTAKARAMDAAPAMLAALQEAARGLKAASEALCQIDPMANAHDAAAVDDAMRAAANAIALATDAPTGEAAPPTAA